MIRVHTTSVSDRDIAAMTKGRGSLVRNILAVSLPMSSVFAALAFWLTKSLLAAAAVGGGLFLLSAGSNVRFFAGVRARRGHSENALEAMEVRAIQVLEIEHLGSHGPAWVFLTEEGPALLLVGQWLLEQKRFPSLAFTLMRWADSRQPLRIESTGRRIKPVHSTARLESHYRLSDIELFPARAESLQEDLRAAFAKAQP